MNEIYKIRRKKKMGASLKTVQKNFKHIFEQQWKYQIFELFFLNEVFCR